MPLSDFDAQGERCSILYAKDGQPPTRPLRRCQNNLWDVCPRGGTADIKRICLSLEWSPIYTGLVKKQGVEMTKLLTKYIKIIYLYITYNI